MDNPIWGPKGKIELRPFIYLNMTFKKIKYYLNFIPLF